MCLRAPQPLDDWVHVRLYNPDNTQQLALSTTISILENEATVHHITVPPDTMRAAFLDRRMPEGAIIVYVPKALYTVLLRDTPTSSMKTAPWPRKSAGKTSNAPIKVSP